MNEHIFFKSYIAFSILYLGIIFTGEEAIAELVKPIPVIFLLLAVHFHEPFRSKKLLLKALSFSWFGTVVLLFSKKNEMYFSSGLLAFLISHLIYIALFNKQLKLRNRKNKAVFWVGMTGIIFYLVLMLIAILPSLGNMKILFFIYTIVISTLLLFAFKGFLIWERPVNNYIFIGSLILVSSDTLLLFNTFYEPILFQSFLITTSYLIAQYLIVKGIFRLNKKETIS